MISYVTSLFTFPRRKTIHYIKDTEHLSIRFEDIKLATKNFTTLIGKGGYGKVYKGELTLNGKLITVLQKMKELSRDIKSSNLLIDENWKAMIADLGLSKLGRAKENDTYLITNACGTQVYCDPAYVHTGVLTKESDVYSFGVVLFEVLCERLCFKNVNNEQRFLAPLAQRYYEEGKLSEIIDPHLKNHIDPDSFNTVSQIAYECLQNDRHKRPSMGYVVEKLVEALELQVLM